MEKNKEAPKPEKKNKKYLVVLIIIILLVLFFLFFRKVLAPETISNNPKGLESTATSETDTETEISALSPEEVLESLETDDSLGENVSLTIVSPEGDTFMPAQARLWRAEFSDIETDDSFLAECKWSFYLNENNEEVLYKEQETRSGVSKASPQVCGFTSTLIESRGELRAEVNVTVKDTTGEEIGTYQAERTYTVQ